LADPKGRFSTDQLVSGQNSFTFCSLMALRVWIFGTDWN